MTSKLDDLLAEIQNGPCDDGHAEEMLEDAVAVMEAQRIVINMLLKDHPQSGTATHESLLELGLELVGKMLR